MTTNLATSPEAPPPALPFPPSSSPPATAAPPGSLAPAHVVPSSELPDGSPRAHHLGIVGRSHVAGDTSLVSRAIPNLHAVDATPRIEHFASSLPPRGEKASVLSPGWRARPALELPSPAALAELVLADVPPAALEAMRAREGRSALDPGATRERAPYDAARASVPSVVLDATPVTSWSSPSACPREPRRSVLNVQAAQSEPQRGTPVLYAKERP